jgi:hypothetical protein
MCDNRDVTNKQHEPLRCTRVCRIASHIHTRSALCLRQCAEWLQEKSASAHQQCVRLAIVLAMTQWLFVRGAGMRALAKVTTPYKAGGCPGTAFIWDLHSESTASWYVCDFDTGEDAVPDTIYYKSAFKSCFRRGQCFWGLVSRWWGLSQLILAPVRRWAGEWLTLYFAWNFWQAVLSLRN